ncbi:MAG: hypothetical protein U0Y10_13390 [Spirosomataceae bacterium]
MKQLLFLLLTMLNGVLAMAQDTSHTKPLDALNRVIQQQNTSPVSLQGIQAPDSISREQMATLQQAYTETRLFAYKHIQRTYEWNYTSTLIIFWTVILLVISGLIFSAVQFYKSVVEARRNKQAPETSTIEASLQGIKVTSSVLGVIILVISMLFFYLYLAHVYPVITVPK